MLNVADEMLFNDIEIISVPIQIKGIKYKLVEASAEVAAKYRNKAMSGTTFSDGRPTGVSGLGDLQILLVSLCLYQVTVKGVEEALSPVSEEFVKKLPDRILKPIFERAKLISELNEGGDETIADLEKQISDLTKKLEQLKSKDATLKNELTPTEPQSKSPVGLD